MSEALSLELIRKTFAGECDIHLLQSVDSTNEWVLQKTRAGAKLPLACFAEEQTRGRGRRGKSWLSPAGAHIAMSLAWPFSLPVSAIGSLSLVLGVAVIEALESTGLTGAQLKWPNDVLLNEKKIAGILVETANISENRVTAVIGVGLNYHLPASLDELPDQPWTDVLSELTAGVAVDRSRLAAQLLHHCISTCQRYPQEKSFMLAQFRQNYDACNQKAVSVSLASGEQFHGVACGVTAAGEIRILVEGRERVFNCADISLRTNIQEPARPC